MHPENPSMHAFCIAVSTIFPEILYANTDMYIFTSTFSKDIVLNWLIVTEFFSLGTKHPQPLSSIYA